jgi:hypothetical protein
MGLETPGRRDSLINIFLYIKCKIYKMFIYGGTHIHHRSYP